VKLSLTYLDYQVPFFFDWPDGVKYKTCRKGRRAGITRGAAHAFIEYLMIKEGPLLWGETTHGNIERYYERYFLPVLKDNNIANKFDRQNKKLTIGDQYCDFRSADNPENWEGFGYKYIYLNEAGIILKDRALYINSVLPMLLDYPDSRLIAAGVPKGKSLKDGSEHPFYTLCKRSEDESNRQYQSLHISSYSNPLLSAQDIADLEDEIAIFSPEQIQQEIYGEFLESDASNPFAHQLQPLHETTLAVFDFTKQLYISVDFNLNPFGVIFSHVYNEANGIYLDTFDEAEIVNGSIPAMIDLIKLKYGKCLSNCILTGDSTGGGRDLSQVDQANYFEQIKRGLNLRPSQIVIAANPKHENSRADCNYVLYHNGYFNIRINPSCKGLLRDLKTVQCDALGKLIKKDRKDISQRADLLDTWRYMVHVFLRKYILNHQKNKSIFAI
jgi:hypothetical protein